MALVEVRNLSFSYKENKKSKALNNVSMNIDSGAFVCILGSNGSGKSTLGKILNALLVPQEGSVVVDGLDTSDKANIFEVRKRVALVLQNPDNQIVADTVEDDVAFGVENIGLDLDSMKKRIAQSLSLVGLEGMDHFKPEKLSGGQKQRLAIAGTLALEPKCIVLDEATSMLDPKGRIEVLSAVEKLRKEKGIATVLVTHFMEEAVNASYIYVMDKGTVVLEGKPSYVFSQKELLESLGLELPYSIDLAFRLRNKGMNISPNALDEEALVNEIVSLYGGPLC